MAELNPPLYLDQDDAYSAADLGLPFRDVMGEGVVGLGAGELAVTQDTGSNLKSKVAAGAAWIKGDDDADKQPTYRVYNDAAVLLQHDAADATNPRIDRVIAEVLDATFSGVSKLWRLRIVKGTPTPGATLSNLNGEAAQPVNAITLAHVLIPAGSGAVTNANIADARSSALVGAGAAGVNATPLPTTDRFAPRPIVAYSATNNPLAGVANDLNAIRIHLPFAVTITKLYYSVIVTGGNLDFGIYDANLNAIWRYGSHATPAASTITAYEVLVSAGTPSVASLTLPAGDYYIASGSDSATPQCALVVPSGNATSAERAGLKGVAALDAKPLVLKKAASFPLPASISGFTAWDYTSAFSGVILLDGV